MPAGEGAVQDGPSHVSLDSVPPSSSVKDTLVESIPASGWCGLERNPLEKRMVFPRSLWLMVAGPGLDHDCGHGGVLRPPHGMRLIFPCCARVRREEGVALLDVLIVAKRGATPFCFRNSANNTCSLIPCLSSVHLIFNSSQGVG